MRQQRVIIGVWVKDNNKAVVGVSNSREKAHKKVPFHGNSCCLGVNFSARSWLPKISNQIFHYFEFPFES